MTTLTPKSARAIPPKTWHTQIDLTLNIFGPTPTASSPKLRTYKLRHRDDAALFSVMHSILLQGGRGAAVLRIYRFCSGHTYMRGNK